MIRRMQAIGKVGGKARVPRPAETYRWYRRAMAKLVRKGKEAVW